ncbi:hypothetical protein R0381_003439 [Jeongeupia wiesaeckerbachi]|uniref:hypothetical protein n=1 Tax=Jeongeupia wiesaeckerbachi TaxID=3051218 RepID=UPI003D8047CE
MKKDYSFQYENFVLATQGDLYLLLEKVGTSVSALKFRFSSFKYGGPNDEARGSHPLTKFGLTWYGLYQVENSPWVQEMITANRVHPRHQDSMYADRQHYIACFKDVMLEVVCREFEEIEIEESALLSILQAELLCLE